MDVVEFLKKIYGWIIDEPITAGVIGNATFALIIVFAFKLPQRLIRWIIKRRKLATASKFQFKRFKPKELGAWLEGTTKKLTCYNNPYVPKEIQAIYKSNVPESQRRRIYVGSAEIGKTRAAYEWIMEIAQNAPDADIFMPITGSITNPIDEQQLPSLCDTVVLFYDDIHTFLEPVKKGQQTTESRLISPEDRFEILIDMLQKRCTNLYIVCTARWEKEKAVKSIEQTHDVWKTFDILTLRDATLENETKMIRDIANHLGVNFADGVAEEMAGINEGHSYENTVTFFQRFAEAKKEITIDDLDDYRKSASERWEREILHHLELQNENVRRIVGTMYTLKFELGLPLFQQFIILCAEIGMSGLMKKRKLQSALELLCKHDEFKKEGDLVSCSDYKLEVANRVSSSAQECIEQLYKNRRKLNIEERNSLAYWYFFNGDKLSDLAEMKQDGSLYEQSFEKYEKVVEIKEDCDVYNDWGVALSNLAELKQDESLYRQSIEKFEKAMEIKGDYDTYYNWGLVLYKLAELRQDESLYEQSFEKYKKAVEIKEDDYQAYGNWGAALSDLAKLKQDESLYEQSFEKYKKAVEIKEDDYLAYDNWGIALSDLAKLKQDESLYELSFEKFEKAADIKENYYEAYFNMACDYALMRKASEACSSLDKAFEINPDIAKNVIDDKDFDPIRNDPVFQQWIREHSESVNE